MTRIRVSLHETERELALEVAARLGWTPTEEGPPEVVLAAWPAAPVEGAALVAVVDPDQAEQVLAEGADDVVLRPLRPALLRRRLELLAARRAAEAGEARAREAYREFLHVASHDLGAPLRIVLMYLDLFEGTHGASLDADARNIISRASRAAWNMHAMMDGLLSLSRATQRPIEPQPVALERLVRKVVRDLEKPEVEVAPLPAVIGDPGQLETLVKALLDNALKFHAPNAAPEVSVSAEPDGEDRVWLVIRDRGVGVPERGRGKLFKPFARLHGASAFPGHGLGLALVRVIAERHDADVELSSTVGEGTTVKVSLARA